MVAQWNLSCATTLTPSLPQPVKFLAWKAQANTCKQCICSVAGPVSYNKFTFLFNTVRFDENHFTYMQERKQNWKRLRISDLTLLLVISSDMAVKWLIIRNHASCLTVLVGLILDFRVILDEGSILSCLSCMVVWFLHIAHLMGLCSPRPFTHFLKFFRNCKVPNMPLCMYEIKTDQSLC